MSDIIRVAAGDYNIRGDNTTDDTAAIQAAINAAIAAGADTVILPPILSMCKITSQIIIQPQTGQTFASLKILAAGGPQNGYSTYFNYTGPSNSSIFVMTNNMLYCQFNGVGVNLGSGQSNVVVWDIQGGSDMGLYLWEHCNIVFDGVTYCIGWRIGQTPTQSNVPDNVWRQCSVSGTDNTSGCIGVQIGGSEAEVQKFDACGFELLSCGILNGPISTNLSVAANEGDPTIQVFDTFLFPLSGTIQFGDGTQVTYTAKTPTTFTISGGMPNFVAKGTSVSQYVTNQGVYTGISNALTWDGGASGGNARDFQLAGSAKISNAHFEALTPALLVAPAPVLTQAPGGSLGMRTEYYKITFVNPVGETTPSTEVSIVANPSYLVTVTSPSNPGVNIIGYNVYATQTASGAETLQNSSPIPLGTNWTEPTTGLTNTGATPPTVNTTAPNNRFLQPATGASAVSGKIEINAVYIAGYVPPADTNYNFGYTLGVIWMNSNFNLRLINCDIINFNSQYTATATGYFLTIVNASAFGTVCMENCNISATYPFINNVQSWPLYFRHVVLTTTDGLPVSVINQDYEPPIVLTDAATVNIDLSLGTKFLLSMTSTVGTYRTLTLSNATLGIPRFRLFLQQPASGGPCKVTWFGGISWQGVSMPTLSTTANTIDIVAFDEPFNGTYLGTYWLNYP